MTSPGGCASLHHRLMSTAPPGLEITSRSLPAISLGTALVVHFNTLAMMERRPTGFLIPKVCGTEDDYQSGPERRRPKGSANLIYARFMWVIPRDSRSTIDFAAAPSSPARIALFRRMASPRPLSPAA